MHFSAIKDCDIANGPGIRVTLFVSGCTNHCEHCFQPQTWDFNFGEPFTEETENQLLRMLQPAYVRGLTLLGGEPMEPSNQRSLLPFVQKVRTAFPQKDIWCYTGFTYETLLNRPDTRALLQYVDVLVDGPYVESLRDEDLLYRGSSNQRLIDVRASLEQRQVVEWKSPMVLAS